MLNLGWISLPLLTPTLLASVPALQRLSAHAATQSRTITLPESPVIRLLPCTFRSSAQNIPPRVSCMDAHTSHLDTSNSHAVRASIVSTLICEDTFRTTSLPISLLKDCSSRAQDLYKPCAWPTENSLNRRVVFALDGRTQLRGDDTRSRLRTSALRLLLPNQTQLCKLVARLPPRRPRW
jgi:hypothetical protein